MGGESLVKSLSLAHRSQSHLMFSLGLVLAGLGAVANKFYDFILSLSISQVSGSWVNREAETPGAPIPFSVHEQDRAVQGHVAAEAPDGGALRLLLVVP